MACFQLRLLVLLTLICTTTSRDVNVSLSISPDAKVWGRVEPEFLSFTMDWWGPRHEGWGATGSIINADLEKLQVYASEMRPFYLRIGGSQSDTIVYQVRGDERPCGPNHCLSMDRWLEILSFAKRVGCRIVFCLNYLLHTEVDGVRDRKDWDSTNAHDFLNFTRTHGDRDLIYGFELGNELTHNGKATNVTRMRVALRELKEILSDLWPKDPPKVLGPASTGKPTVELVKELGEEYNVITYHKYFGSGKSDDLTRKAQQASYFVHPAMLQERLDRFIPHTKNASVWIGEGAMAFNSGKPNLTDSFLSSLWTANLLGAMSKTSHSVYCRQAFTGGYYEVIRHEDYKPNPDFWMARIWKTIVGDIALGPIISPSRDDPVYLDQRVTWGCCHEPMKDTLLAHAFCAKPSESLQKGDIVFVLINISPRDSFSIDLSIGTNRSEYALTAQNDRGKPAAVGARSVLLNDVLQTVGSDGKLPRLVPRVSTQDKTLHLPPLSMAFVVVHGTSVKQCGRDGAAKAKAVFDTQDEVKQDPIGVDEPPFDSVISVRPLRWLCFTALAILVTLRSKYRS